MRGRAEVPVCNCKTRHTTLAPESVRPQAALTLMELLADPSGQVSLLKADPDGDYYIDYRPWRDSSEFAPSPMWMRSHADGISVYALVVDDVKKSSRLTQELAGITQQVRPVVAFWKRNQVWVDGWLPAEAINQNQLCGLIGTVGQVADSHGLMIATVYGGSHVTRTFADDTSN